MPLFQLSFPAADALIPFALGIVIKTTLLMGLAALAMPLLRRRSAALRHMVWSLALGGAVLLPVVAAVSPLTLPLLPAATASADAVIDAPETPAFAPTESEAFVPAAEPSVDESSPARPLPVAAILLAFWFAGAAALLTRFVIGVRRVRGLARRATPVEDPSWVSVARRTQDIIAPVALRVSDEIDMPFTTGIVAPAIVLPAASAEWSVERREAVLLHELAHLNRGDLLMNVLSHVARAIYWFNPLAWYASHRLRVEGERAADDAVLRRGARPSEYADHLLSIASRGHTSLPSAVLAMARRSAFEGRLLAILAPDVERVAPSRMRVALTAAAVALLLLPLAAASPTARAAALPAQATSERESGPAQQPSGAVPALIEALEDSSAEVRLAAVNSLASLEDPRAIAALGKALKEDADPRVREAAAHALAEIDDPRAVPHLVEALRAERVTGVREQIVHALGELGVASSLSAISSAAKDPSVQVRRAVANALSQFDEQATLPTLLTMARDEDIEVRRHVADALGELDSMAAFDVLVTLAKDADAEVRANAVSSLGELEDQRSLGTLVAALRDPNAEVRSNAADAIHNIPDMKSAPTALIEALRDPSPDVRHNVAHALGSIGDEAAVPALKRALADTHAETRRAVAEALSEIGGAEAITALMGLLKDPDPEVRKTAAEALGKRR